MQSRYFLRVQAQQLRCEQIGKQVVVAVPNPLVIERN